jgi:molybdenum cofactor guanylyltransferase
VKLLGAIIAGGGSRRFDGDKAAALLNGRALIDHVADALAPQVDAVVVCGRDWPGLPTVADQPQPDLGPLGGLCGALHHAELHGFDAVLTAGCDVLPVPDLRALVGPVAAVVEGQRLFGFWPVALRGQLDAHLADQADRSLRHWMAVSRARSVACAGSFHNLNTRADFALYSDSQGLAA